MNLTANNVDTATRCGIVFLRPYDPIVRDVSRAHPGKTLFPNPDDDICYAAEDNAWFNGTEIAVDSVRSLHDIIVRQSDEKMTFAIRGGLLRPGARFCSRRKSLGDGRRMPGISVVARRWEALDIDDLPNPLGFDPRVDAKAAAEWIRSLLPGDIRRATVSVGWSSSCCARSPTGTAPTTISCKLWFWMTTAVGEQDAARMMRAIRAEVISKLDAQGVAAHSRVVDPAVATANQPIYIAAPKFSGGLVDPLPSRNILIEGELEAVDPAPFLTPTHGPVAAAVKRARAHLKTVAKPTLALMDVIPLAAASRLLAARREADAQRGKSGNDYRDACLGLYMRRWPPELVALVLWRRGRAEAGDARYAEWINGVPVGQRNKYALMLSSGVVAGLPTGLGEVRIRQEIRSLLGLIVPNAWLSSEWEGTADKSVVGRYMSAPEVGYATLLGPRYTYSKATLVEEIEVTEEEVEAVGLRSLASDAMRLRADRSGDAALLRAERAARDAEVVRLTTAGMSIRQAAERAGVSKSTAGRIIAAHAKGAWDRAVAAERAAEESRRAVRTAPEPTEADVLVLERKAAVTGARKALENLARVSGLSVAELKGHVRDWLHDESQAPQRRAA